MPSKEAGALSSRNCGARCVSKIRVCGVRWVRRNLFLGENSAAVLSVLSLGGLLRVVPSPSYEFTATGLNRSHWSNATPVRQIFKQAFESAGLPYFNPHSFRYTLVNLGEKLCKTPEAFKAWSQNLGHEGVLTTFYSYGAVAASRQGEILSELAPAGQQPAVGKTEDIQRLLRHMQNPVVLKALAGVVDR